MDKRSTAIQDICGAMGGLFPATYIEAITTLQTCTTTTAISKASKQAAYSGFFFFFFFLKHKDNELV